MKLILLISLLLLSASDVHAETLSSSSAAVAVTDQTMKRIAAGDLRGGLGLTKKYMSVPGAEIDAIIGQAELQQPVFLSRFGKSIGYELIRNDTVSDSLSRVVYIQRYESHAMVWQFVLYRGIDGWSINSFKYMDDISVLF